MSRKLMPLVIGTSALTSQASRTSFTEIQAVHRRSTSLRQFDTCLLTAVRTPHRQECLQLLLLPYHFCTRLTHAAPTAHHDGGGDALNCFKYNRQLVVTVLFSGCSEEQQTKHWCAGGADDQARMHLLRHCCSLYRGNHPFHNYTKRRLYRVPKAPSTTGVLRSIKQCAVKYHKLQRQA